MFEHIAIENLGTFSSSTLNFLFEMCRRITTHSGNVEESLYLFKRISVAIQRFNSVLLHDTSDYRRAATIASIFLLVFIFSF